MDRAVVVDDVARGGGGQRGNGGGAAQVERVARALGQSARTGQGGGHRQSAVVDVGSVDRHVGDGNRVDPAEGLGRAGKGMRAPAVRQRAVILQTARKGKGCIPRLDPIAAGIDEHIARESLGSGSRQRQRAGDDRTPGDIQSVVSGIGKGGAAADRELATYSQVGYRRRARGATQGQIASYRGERGQGLDAGARKGQVTVILRTVQRGDGLRRTGILNGTCRANGVGGVASRQRARTANFQGHEIRHRQGATGAGAVGSKAAQIQGAGGGGQVPHHTYRVGERLGAGAGNGQVAVILRGVRDSHGLRGA